MNENLNGGEALVASPVGWDSRKLQVPADQSIFSAVQAGMEAFPDNTGRGAKSISMGVGPFRFLRKLALLSTRNISVEDKAKLQELWATIERERCLSLKVKQEIRELLRRNWVERTHLGQKVHQTKKKQQRFDMTLLHIRESCATTSDMELPKLMAGQRDKAIRDLSFSVRMIAQLIARLVGSSEDQEDSNDN